MDTKCRNPFWWVMIFLLLCVNSVLYGQQHVSLTGCVTDETGSPVTEARVTAFPETAILEKSTSTTIDLNGCYTIPNLKKGYYEVLAEAEEYVPAVKTHVWVGSDAKPVRVDFAVYKGGEISGRVAQKVDGKEQPVEGAVVTATPYLCGADGAHVDRARPKMKTKSDSNGSFFFSDIPYGTRIFVRATFGLFQMYRDVNLSKDKEQRSLMFLLPEPGHISGRVIDRDQNPVKEAEVWIRKIQFSAARWSTEFDEEKTRVLTDEHGGFVLERIPPDSKVYLRARKEGYAITELRDAQPDEEEAIEVILRRPGKLTGRVVVMGTVNPVAGYRVNIRPGYKSEACFEGHVAETDADGIFVVSDMFPDTYYAENSLRQTHKNAPLLVPRGNYNIEIKESEGTEIFLQAIAPATIKGQILVRETGEQIERIEVTAYHKSPFSTMYDIFTGGMGKDTTAPDGGFEIHNMLPGDLWLQFSGRGFVTPKESEVHVDAGETSEYMQIYFSRGLSVRGVALDSQGNPVPNLKVQLLKDNRILRSATADKKGCFLFSGIPYETKTVRVVTDHRIKGKYFGESETVSIGKEIPEPEITLKLTVGGTITGRIIDTASKPVEGVYVRAKAVSKIAGRSFSKSGSTNKQGTFTIGGLPEAEYTISANKRYYIKKYVESLHVQLGKSVTIPDIVLKSTGSFEAVLVDHNGVGLSGWEISGKSVNSSQGGNVYSESDRNGRFVFKELGTCKYRLVFKHHQRSGDLDWSVEYNTGAIDLKAFAARHADKGADPVFTCDLGGVIKGRILAEGAGEPLKDLRFRLLDLKTAPVKPSGEQCVPTRFRMSGPLRITDEGYFEVTGIAPGRYNLDLSGDNVLDKTARDIQIVSGSTNNLGVIQVTKGYVAFAYLLDGETGHPLINNQVAIKGWNTERKSISLRFNLELIDPRFPGYLRITNAPADLEKIVVKVEDYRPKILEDIHINPEGETDLGEIVLDRGPILIGRLIDKRTGEPFTGSHLDIEGHTEEEGTIKLKINFDRLDPVSKGSFRIINAPVNLDGLTFKAERYLPAVLSNIEIEPEGETNLGDVALDSGITLVGRFINSKTKEPCEVKFVRLKAYSGSDEEISGLELEALDAGGYFVIHTAPYDITQIAFISNDYLPLRIERIRNPDEEGSLDLGNIPLDPGLNVNGVVTDEKGKPVEKAFVVANSRDGKEHTSRHTYTNRQGEYTIRGLREGTYLVEMEQHPYARQQEKDVRISHSEPLPRIDFILDTSRIIKGRLVDQNGESLERWRLFTYPVDDRHDRVDTKPTGPDGSFQFSGLPADEYEVGFSFSQNNNDGKISINCRTVPLSVTDEEQIIVLPLSEGLEAALINPETAESLPSLAIKLEYDASGRDAPLSPEAKSQLWSYSFEKKGLNPNQDLLRIRPLPVGKYILEIKGRNADDPYLRKAISVPEDLPSLKTIELRKK